MKKGVTLAQGARVARAFTDAGIFVHAYLMYGFATESEQEIIDSLERVRQQFSERCIQAGFWLRLAATAHSPIGQKPALFGLRLLPEPTVTFARNAVPFIEPTGCDPERLGQGLGTGLPNFMRGVGLQEDVRSWCAVPAQAGIRRCRRRSLASVFSAPDVRAISSCARCTRTCGESDATYRPSLSLMVPCLTSSFLESVPAWSPSTTP